MATKQLSEVLKNGNKNKISIGYAVSGYEKALTAMGSVYGNNYGSLTKRVTYVETDDGTKEQSTGLGSASIKDETAVNGFYSEHQLAAVHFFPVTSVSYTGENDAIICGTVDCSIGDDGIIIGNKKLGIPKLFDKATINSLKNENSGDFIVGCGIDLSGDFGQKYIAQFYPQFTTQEFLKLAAVGVLYAELFFPSQTSGSGDNINAQIMVSRVIYNPPCGDAAVDAEKNLTYWKCYVPTPVLLVSPYNQEFSFVDSQGSTINTPTFGTDAIYSYVNSTIKGYSPAVLANLIEQKTPPTEQLFISKWPGLAEGGTERYGRIRLLVPPDMAETAEQELNGKKIPDSLKTLTDPNIATGILKTPVSGSDSDFTAMSGDFWYDASALNLSSFASPAVFERAIRTMWTFESGTTYPTKQDVLTANGPEKEFVSWGPFQICGCTLLSYLLYLGVSEDEARELSKGKKDETAWGSAIGQKSQILAKINDIAYKHYNDNHDALIKDVTKFWWGGKDGNQKTYNEYRKALRRENDSIGWSYGQKALNFYNACRFQSQCCLGFAMCLYLSNGPSQLPIAKGDSHIKFFNRLSGSDLDKCKAIANKWSSHGNYNNAKKFFTYMCNSGDVSYTNELGHINMAQFGHKGTL